MLFTLRELVKWLGVTVFEIAVNLIAVTVFAVLAVLNYENLISVSWWTVFIPLFVCDGLNSYFCAIIFIRMYLDGIYKNAALRALWSFSVLVLLFVFKLLVCQKIQHQNTLAYSEVMSPIFILLVLVMIRTCQLH